MKRLLIAVAALLMIGCATRMEHPSASLTDQKMIRESAIEKGLARVHFYMGEEEMYGAMIPINRSMEIFINNQSAGIVGNKNEFICVDLYPGEYSFVWRSVGTTDRSYEMPRPLVLNINESDLVFLSADSSLTNSSLLAGGLLSAATMKLHPTFNRAYSVGQQKISQKRLILRNTIIKDSVLPLKSEKPETITSLKPAPIEEENKNQSAKPETGIHEKLEQLKKLYDDNLITKEDYDKKRKELVDNF